MMFLVEEVRKNVSGSWDFTNRRILGYKEAPSLREATKELGAITTCCGEKAKLFVEKWTGNTRGWILTPLEKI